MIVRRPSGTSGRKRIAVEKIRGTEEGRLRPWRLPLPLSFTLCDRALEGSSNFAVACLLHRLRFLPIHLSQKRKKGLESEVTGRKLPTRAPVPRRSICDVSGVAVGSLRTVTTHSRIRTFFHRIVNSRLSSLLPLDVRNSALTEVYREGTGLFPGFDSSAEHVQVHPMKALVLPHFNALC